MGWTFIARIGLMLLLLSPAVRAQSDGESSDNAFADIAGRWYVSPMYSFVRADDRRHADNGTGWLVAVGKNVNRYFNLEVYGFRDEYDSLEEGGRTAVREGAGIAASGFPFGRRADGWSAVLGGAYGLIGVGYGEARDFPLRAGLYDSNGSRFILDAGLGYLARIPLLRLASVRLDARYRLDIDRHPYASVEHDQENDDADFGDVVLSIGLVIPLGAAPQGSAPPPAPEVVPVGDRLELR